MVPRYLLEFTLDKGILIMGGVVYQGVLSYVARG
jgi:hypothetical protein